MLATALTAIALAAAPTTATRDAPWRLTGISPDQRTLHLVYEGGGCLRPDGQASVDTSDPAAVKVIVRQSQVVGDYAICTQELGFLPLDVPLSAPLAGRSVTGGPDFPAVFPVKTMPNVVGLRRKDAVAALGRQGIKSEVIGRRTGVVHAQGPREGAPAPRRASLLTGPFDARARLRISIPAGQTAESVLRRGLRYRYRVDPAVEKLLLAIVECNGQDGGNDDRPAKAKGRLSVDIAYIGLRRQLRRRRLSTCRLTVASYPADARDANDWFLERTATVTLRHR